MKKIIIILLFILGASCTDTSFICSNETEKISALADGVGTWENDSEGLIFPLTIDNLEINNVVYPVNLLVNSGFTSINLLAYVNNQQNLHFTRLEILENIDAILIAEYFSNLGFVNISITITDINSSTITFELGENGNLPVNNCVIETLNRL